MADKENDGVFEFLKDVLKDEAFPEWVFRNKDKAPLPEEDKPKDDKMKVGVFAALRGPNDSFLLVQLSYKGQKFSLPGGKLKQGELAPDGCLRKVLEKSGVTAKLDRLVGVFSQRKDYGLVLLFEGRITGGQLRPDHKETSYCGFFKISELKPEEIYPAQLSLLMWTEKTKGRTSPVFGWLTVPPTPEPD